MAPLATNLGGRVLICHVTLHLDWTKRIVALRLASILIQLEVRVGLAERWHFLE